MQDSMTGLMVPLESQAMNEAISKELAGKLQAAEIKLQAAKDAALPVRTRQGPVFRVGEILEIRGGKFRVLKLKRQGIVLKGIAS
jgi:hypothetical protein